MDIAWFTDTWLPTRDGVVTSLQSFKHELCRVIRTDDSPQITAHVTEIFYKLTFWS